MILYVAAIGSSVSDDDQCYLKCVAFKSSPIHHFRMAKRRITEQRRFGSVVRSRRLTLGISQEELAARARVHRTYIGSVERGERNISLLNIHALAKALGTTAGSLLTESEDLME
jgi:ribosome-binding protein aMBF1 (putative translation factor)